MDSQEKWDNSWGDDYGQSYERSRFIPLFNKMSEEGRLGENIVDVGSGMYPVTSSVPEEIDARIISIDCSGGEGLYAENRLKLQFNLDDIDQKALVRKKVSRVADFLEIDQCDSLRQIDCFVFSNILNYVDYRKTLLFLKQYLRKGGRFVIYEGLKTGYKNRFSPLGYDGTENLYELLRGEGFVIEQGPRVDYCWDSIVVARLDA